MHPGGGREGGARILAASGIGGGEAATTGLPAVGGSDTDASMQGLVMGLLACFGLVVAGAVAMILVHRRHLREWRLSQPWGASPGRWNIARQAPLALPLPGRWLAVRSGNAPQVREMLGVEGRPVPWSEALSRAGERRLFVSAAVSGWIFVVGRGLPDPVQDVDALYLFLSKASRSLGEVQFFSMDRVLGHHAWARLRDGLVLRGYAWSGVTEWNEGRLTLEERLLDLRCHEYGDATPAGWTGGVTSEIDNAERVPLLARRWGMDLAGATEILLQAEGVRSDEGNEAA